MAINNEDHILAILTRYLKDDVVQEEENFVDDWIAKSEDNKKYFEEVKLLWQALEGVADFDKIDINEEWKIFKSRTEKVQTPEQPKKGFNLVFLKIAASVAIIFGLGVYFLNRLNSDVTLLAQIGKENKFILPDQSVVWLKEGSELTYSKDFKGNERTSELKGEGFFEVIKNPNKPFVVKANNTETRVLGTSFNLKANTKTKYTELVLVTGKVQFTSKNQKEILEPRDKVTAHPNGTLLKKVNDNPNFISWKSKVLKFEDRLMKDVVVDIEQFYGVKFVLENGELSNCTLTSVFENETVEDVLATLTILFDITHEKLDSNRILIKGGDCNS